MTDDPEITAMVAEILKVPLNISSTRRSGNGLRNADDVAIAARKALDEYRAGREHE